MSDLKEMFYYLDNLKESADSNMFGASPYLVDEFNIDKSEARKVLAKWFKEGDNCRRCKDDEGYGRIKLCNSCRDDMRS
jgi:hypothetical protein